MTPGLTPAQRSILGTVEPFRDLDAVALDAIAASLDVVELPADSLLIGPSDADRAFVIFEGRLESRLTRDDQGTQSLAEHGPGDLLGELVHEARGITYVSVRSVSPVTAGAIPTARLARIAEGRPELRAAIAALAARRLRRARLAIYLGGVFGAVDRRVLDDIEATVEFLAVPGGSVLFRQGDVGDAAYLLLGGRLRVAVAGEGREERLLHDVGPGEIVGEMALLTQSPRSATVHAVRDSELVRLSAAVFEQLTMRYPQFLAQVARALAGRLQRANASRLQAPPRPRTLTLVPIGPEPIAEFAADLAAALSRHASTVLVTRDVVERSVGLAALADDAHDHPATLRLSHWLDEIEAGYEHVLLLADERWTPWSERALRRADHVLLVASARSDRALREVERQMAALWSEGTEPRRTLILTHEPDLREPRGTARWLAGRTLDGHLHVRTGRRADIERVARIVTGRAVTLVLGGGGARGFVHIGVLRALEELGIPIDMIGGTSMGAIIGATRAMGWDSAETLRRCTVLFAGLFDVTLPLVSILAGRRILRSLERGFGNRAIEDLWLPYFCVSSNLTRAEQVVDRTGSLRLAVRASLSLPGVVPPVYRDGDLLVDGGLLNNVPVDVMRRLNQGGRIIAVDVSPAVDLATNAPFAPDVSGWTLLASRLNPFRDTIRVPGLLGLLNRSAVLGSVFLRNQMRNNRPADLYLEMPVSDHGLLEFDHVTTIARQGYERSLPAIRAWWATATATQTATTTASPAATATPTPTAAG